MVSMIFRKEFEKKIQNGIKKSTIRKIKKDGRKPCKAGDKIIMYAGAITEHSTAFFVTKCKSIDFIKITKEKVFTYEIMRDNTRGVISKIDKEWLAKCEGFKNWDEMLVWFLKIYRSEDFVNEGFMGYFIQW